MEALEGTSRAARSRSAAVRRTALEVLATFRLQHTIRVLIKALSDRDSDVRAWAGRGLVYPCNYEGYRALGRIGSKDALSVLKEYRDSEDKNARIFVACALAAGGDAKNRLVDGLEAWVGVCNKVEEPEIGVSARVALCVYGALRRIPGTDYKMHTKSWRRCVGKPRCNTQSEIGA